MERDQEGYATTNGLFSIISTLGTLPGRKSLILFSEGIAIPPAVQRLFLGVIDAANRANVSIYTMDAAGLRAESEQAMIRDQVNAGRGVGATTGYSAEPGAVPFTKALEKNEESCAGPALRPGHARPGHRRADLRQHQQPPSGVRPRRDRSPQLLPRGLYAQQRPTTGASARSRSR